MIVVGDFNLVMDPSKYSYDCWHGNSFKAKEDVWKQMHILNLTNASLLSDLHVHGEKYALLHVNRVD